MLDEYIENNNNNNNVLENHFIPQEEFKKMTPGMRQYWEIKSNNFDKIVIQRMGYWF